MKINKELLKSYIDLKETTKQIKIEMDNIKNEIITSMEGEEKYEDAEYLIDNILVKSKRLNITLFKTDHKDMYEKYLTESISKRFTIKEKKEEKNGN